MVDIKRKKQHQPKQITASDRKLAMRIRRLRESKGLSQTYMSEQLGISSTQYQKYEKARTRITIQRLKEIAAALQVKVAVLLDEDIDLSMVKLDLLQLKQLIQLYEGKIDDHLRPMPRLDETNNC